MPLMRFIILFTFVALSLARAQVNPLNILFAGEALTSSTISVIYGLETKEIFSIDPSEPEDEYKWCLTEAICFSGNSFSVPIPAINPPEGYPILYTVTVTRSSDSQTQTININIINRPSYTVNFMNKDGTIFEFTSILKGDKVSEPLTEPTATGYNFKKWDFDFNTEINANTDIVSIWEPIIYTITYNLDGGTNAAANPATYTIESQTITLQNPTKTGYTFNGWTEETSIPTGSTGNKTFTATWQINIYTVTFNSNGGSSVENKTVNYGETVAAPITPTYTGHDFEYWELNATQYNFATPVTSSITLTAKWKIKTYTVSFNSNGGSPIESKTVNHGETVTSPTVPTYKGYNFEYWELNSTQYDFATPVTSNITLTAKWEIITYTITYNLNGGTNNAANPATYTVESQSINLQNPTKTGYTFNGWTEGTSIPTGSTGNKTFNATWEPIIYTITYNLDGGTNAAANPATYTIESQTITLQNPTKTGYTFNDWTEGTSIPTGSTGNKTFTANWQINIYTVTFNSNGGTITTSPLINSYTIESSAIIMPSIDVRCGYRFDGWFDNENFAGQAITTFTPSSNNIGNKTFYAKWTNTPVAPTVNMLSVNLSANKTYDATSITPTTAVSTSVCEMGTITILYNNSPTVPINAGTYQIHASIAENEIYTAANFLLGSATISKADLTVNLANVIINDKEYDATKNATIKSLEFVTVPVLFGSDKITTADYSVSATFPSPNVGEQTVALQLTLLKGPLSQNYNITLGTIAKTNAKITKATNTFLEIEAEDYELSATELPKLTIRKSSFINANDIKIEYKRENATDYISMEKPNRVGIWNVRASVKDNNNYEGKTYEASFNVTRGSTTTIIHNISFENTGFTKDPALSSNLKSYYVANSSLCNIKNTSIEITVIEPDIILKIANSPQIGKPYGDGGAIYNISYNFGKPKLDTLIYTLLSKDNIYTESDTILIETPIPFETITRQKWNNTLFINNNPLTNGGYSFTDFEWFKNDVQVSNLQFYSAGTSSQDTLNPSDIYKAVMHTIDGIRISSCEGTASVAESKINDKETKFSKQVLGLNKKNINSNVYDLKGKLKKETPPGVYIVEN